MDKASQFPRAYLVYKAKKHILRKIDGRKGYRSERKRHFVPKVRESTRRADIVVWYLLWTYLPCVVHFYLPRVAPFRDMEGGYSCLISSLDLFVMCSALLFAMWSTLPLVLSCHYCWRISAESLIYCENNIESSVNAKWNALDLVGDFVTPHFVQVNYMQGRIGFPS